MNIVITGATSGIGRQLALDYHQEGHRVWAVGRNQQALDELSQQGIQAIQVDLSNRKETIEKLGAIHQVDLALLAAGNCIYMDASHFDSRIIAQMLEDNVMTMANSIEALLPALRQSERPHVAGIGSSASFLPLARAEGYGASKAAVAYMLETLRISLFKEGIQVSLVSPGFVQTPLTDKNDFSMPLRITTQKASKVIRKEIGQGLLDIHVPKSFTYCLKILSFLPKCWWVRLAQRLVRP